MASSRGVDYFSPSNPDAPYFAIKIQNKIYDIDINYIESLTITRKLDEAGTFEFTIYNAADHSLEEKFLKLISQAGDMETNMFLQYGWSLGERSRWFAGLINDYSPSFIPGGYTKLTVTGILVANSTDISTVIRSYSGTSISEIVTEIASDFGWVVEEIEETTPLKEKVTIRITNATAIDTIREQLEPIATNSNNEPMVFYLDNNNGQDHVYFVSANKGIAAQKNYNFFVNMGNYGSVLSWTPQYKGSVVASLLYAQSALVDEETNDVYVNGTSNEQSSSGSKLTIYGSTSPDRMTQLLANKWYQENIGCITGTLEIVGDPTLVPQMKVNVMPMDMDGNPQYSTGTYLVTQIVDSISGSYTTQLELTQAGVEDGTKTMNLTEAVQLQGKV